MVTMGDELRCPEDGCDGVLTLKESVHGKFFGCTRWSETRCRGSIGAHPNGRPLGIPAPASVKRLRVEAHEAFDVLWRNGIMSRREAYRWLAERMGREVVHIGEMGEDECRRVIELMKGRS